MKVLIVGGTGNISTPITELLLERGDEVTLVNRGKSDDSSNVQSARLDRLHRITADRKSYSEFERAMRSSGTFDAVIDMVCFLEEEAESAIRAFRGITNQYVFCSTVDVYSKNAKRYPIVEDDERRPLLSFPYAYQKAKCEERLIEADRRGDFKLTIIRPAATYSNGGPIHSFRGGTYNLDRIEKGKPIILHGDGMSIWSACHSIDVARAFVNALGNPKAYGNAYHVTGEEWMTWNYYWQCAADAVGSPLPELVHIPTDLLIAIAPDLASWAKENFQHNNIFDNSRAREDLGFRYTVRWKDGIRAAVEHLRANGPFEDSAKYPWYDRIIEVWKRHSAQMIEELKSSFS